MQQILVIEDEEKMARSLKVGLEEHHYKVDLAFNGITGKQMVLENNYDLIISDIIMPGLNGIALCQQLREEHIETPVLMLTALGTVADKVEGFQSGADDYLSKPFEFEELLVRVQALLKRSQWMKHKARELSIADLVLNLDTKTAKRNGREIELTAKEYALLECFLQNQGRVLSKSDIAEKVWGIDFDTGTNIVEVYVNYLRKKIDKDFTPKLIHTVIGLGYILKEK